MRNREKPVPDMTNEELVDDYGSIQRWAGDDFAVDPIPEEQWERGYAIKAEILARMKSK